MSDQSSRFNRRSFIKTAAVLGVLPLAASCDNANNAVTQDGPQTTQAKTTWSMVTAWPPNFPILQTGVERFADRVATMSHGALEIEVHAGGELVPPLGVFDAVAQGSVQAGNGASYYWASQVPAAQFFTAIPFGFTFEEMMTWLHSGSGLELWEEIYAPFNVVPIPMLTTSYQMGGWFNRKIESARDLQGLKMRIAGLGGKVLAKAGTSVVLLPAAELFTALQTGTIDATEWVGPYHDVLLGFPQIAHYYYGPGWHEPGPVAELSVHKSDWDALPNELQQIVRAAAADTTLWSLEQFEYENGVALNSIAEEYPDVEILRFPDEVLNQLRVYADEVYDEESDRDVQFAQVRESVDAFRETMENWRDVSALALLETEENTS